VSVQVLVLIAQLMQTVLASPVLIVTLILEDVLLVLLSQIVELTTNVTPFATTTHVLTHKLLWIVHHPLKNVMSPPVLVLNAL
jgi:hypothetical protein